MNRRTLLLGSVLSATTVASARRRGARLDGVALRRDGSRVTVTTRRLTLSIDLATGLWSARWPDENVSLADASCGASREGVAETRAPSAARRTLTVPGGEIVDEPFGHGLRVTIAHETDGAPDLLQRFTLFPETPFFLTRTEIRAGKTGPRTVRVVKMDVIADVSCALGGVSDKPRTLFVPYDNDEFVRYNSEFSTASFGVTALYDEASRRGVVIGATTHDLWKVGLAIDGHAPGRVGKLTISGGITGYWTHDKEPHGIVGGASVESPEVFVGAFSDWRDGLETFGRACVRRAPALPWNDGVPVGWNSWSAHKETVRAKEYDAASRFLDERLKPLGFAGENGATFVNIDAFWDFIPEGEFLETVAKIRARGQKAGIYWTPFTYWGDDFARKVDGTDGVFTYADILLKGANGEFLPKLDNGRAIDITHPAALARIDWQMKRFVAWGFSYVKLDFLTHGALEGKRFDPNVATGVAAYRLGMKRVLSHLDPKKIGRDFFVSLSIAPLFPSGFAHARRVSCDAFGTIGHTEYLLNAVTFGWWQSGTLYKYNDPDHTVLYREHGQSPTTEHEARSRLNASVIGGTVLLLGDDCSDPAVRARTEALLADREIVALAKDGRPFRPTRGDTAANASDVFVRSDPGGALVVAVFNFDGKSAVKKTISLARLGLTAGETYGWRDLWRGMSGAATGTLAVDLAPAESTVLRLTRG